MKDPLVSEDCTADWEEKLKIRIMQSSAGMAQRKKRRNGFISVPFGCSDKIITEKGFHRKSFAEKMCVNLTE